jgi:hypothetical protein
MTNVKTIALLGLTLAVMACDNDVGGETTTTTSTSTTSSGTTETGSATTETETATTATETGTTTTTTGTTSTTTTGTTSTTTSTTTTTTTSPLDTDNDGDGFTENEGDCDDTLSAVNPLAVELCNKMDDNCNGAVDDDPLDGNTYYADDDSDGFGDAAESMRACDLPAGYVDNSSDCDDTDSSVGLCDTGDTGVVVVNHDGSYTGNLYAEIDLPDLGLSDICNVPFNSLTFNTAATPQLRGNADCLIEVVFLGTPISQNANILINANMTSEPNFEGFIELDTYAEAYEGSFVDADTLYADYSIEIEVKLAGDVTFDGNFSASR